MTTGRTVTGTEIVVLDMAGTTVVDDGLVEDAFTAAIGDLGVRPGTERFTAMFEYVRETMGQSKIMVFRALLNNAEDAAQQANAAFERYYAEFVHNGRCAPIPGAEEAISGLRSSGRKVALVTGFARPTQDAILAALGWQDIADLTLTPADAGRGRPFPDLVLTALLRLGGTDVRRVAVAGDTPSDIHTGLRAGAGVVAGVLTGAGTTDQLRSAGATHVLSSVADLPALLDLELARD
ncbi:MAG TPA: phosphonatase-like hydrolase [Pseudonocardiaceae bacterium]